MDKHELNLVRIAIRTLTQSSEDFESEKKMGKKKKKKKKKIGHHHENLTQEEIAIEKPASKIKTRFPQLVAKSW